MLHCEPWRALGLPCPYVLLEAVKKRRKEKVREPAPKEKGVREEEEKAAAGDRVSRSAEKERSFDAIPLGDRLKRQTTVTMQDWEALLLEIARQSASRTIQMPQTHVPVPNEIVEEAVRQGARGPALGLWVAAVAAVLAALLAGGNKAALAVPGALRAVTDLPRSVRPGGSRFNAAAALEFALQSVGGRTEGDLDLGGPTDFTPWDPGVH